MSKPQYSGLVGITGKAGAGKNTFAEEFHYYGFKEYSFADPVKAACIAAFGLEQHHFTDRNTKEDQHPYWDMSPRVMAQLVGTELFRKFFGADFWIRRLELQLILDHECPEDVMAVITDVRFQNEAEWILSNGGVLIHLTRPGADGNVGVSGHASESGLIINSLFTKENYHVIHNDSTKDDLILKSRKFIETFLT